MAQVTAGADLASGGIAARPINTKQIFWASFLTLIAAGIGFAVRGAILGDWGAQFGFTKSELGSITGGGRDAGRPGRVGRRPDVHPPDHPARDGRVRRARHRLVDLEHPE